MPTSTRYVTDQGAYLVGDVREIREATRALSCSIEVGPPSNRYRVSVPFYELRQGATFVPYAGYASSKWDEQCTNTRSRSYEPFDSVNFLGHLRPEQERIVSKTEHSMRHRSPGAIVHCPTGGGKTVMALALVERLGLVPMIVAHKRVLVDQWKERIKTFYGEETPIRRLQDSDAPHIVVETIQTAMRQDIPVPPHVGMLIIDECHHIAADVFKRLLLRSTTKYVLGLTATPDRKDGLRIETLIGPIISDPASSGSIQNSGRVTVLRVPYWTQTFMQHPPISDRTGSIMYNAMVSVVVDDVVRTERIASLVQNHPMLQGRDILVLSHRRSHVTALVDMMTLKGLEADEFVPTQGKKMRSCPTTRIVVSTYNYVAEGLDEPRFSVVVLATSTIGSPMEQACGRVMRRMHDASSDDPIIVDIADAWSVFRSHSSKRMTWYKTQGFSIQEHQQREPSNVSLFRTEL